MQVYFTVNLGTQAGVRLIESVRLLWGPLNNTGFHCKTIFALIEGGRGGGASEN